MSYRVCILSNNQNNLESCLPPLLPGVNTPIVGFGPGFTDFFGPGFTDFGNAKCWALPQRRIPFGYSREMNCLIRLTESDVILLNDDAVLQTPGGFDELSRLANENPEYGVLSAAVTGVVKRDQRPQRQFYSSCRTHVNSDDCIYIGGCEVEMQIVSDIRPSADRALSFICVYIRREILERVGLLDERFTPGTYGFQDNDYCERVTRAGWKLGIVDSVVVEHGSLPSSYRSHSGDVGAIADRCTTLQDQLLAARKVFAGIWGEELANKHWPMGQPDGTTVHL